MSEPTPRCPVHHTPLLLEDMDSAYGHGVWVCSHYATGCREAARTGPSDTDIYRREQIGAVPRQARPTADPWRNQ